MQYLSRREAAFQDGQACQNKTEHRWGGGTGCSLVTVSEAPELLDAQGLLLDVVLREEARLAGYHLLDRCLDHQVVDVVVAAPGLPALGRNHLPGSGAFRYRVILL